VYDAIDSLIAEGELVQHTRQIELAEAA